MIWLWAIFIAFIILMLALDLGVFHRRLHEISMKEATSWTIVWVCLALSFTVFVYFLYQYRLLGLEAPPDLKGYQASLLFLTGYIVELSLSADNIFVMALIFSYFRVEGAYQHRVLFWGILGAVVLRALMILGGIALINRFDWILYIFGAFLIFSAYRMLFSKGEMDPRKNPAVRLARKLLPVSDEFDGPRFITRHNGKRMLTPLALVLLAVESADVIFAVDSIPAIFAITDVPFIVFTSNIFAILGLRSMYFALSAVLKKFRYLKVSLAVLLAVVGLKMLLKNFVHVPAYVTLGVILLVLAGGIVASILHPGKDAHADAGGNAGH